VDVPRGQQRQILGLGRDLRKINAGEVAHRPILFAARYSTAAGQSINSGGASDTVINFGTMTYDHGGRVTTGAAWVYTCDSAGIYSVTSRILYASSTGWVAGEAASLLLYRNGTVYSSLDRFDGLNAATGMFMPLRGSDGIELAVGDTINIRTFQNSGAALALHNAAAFNYVAIAKIA
jgi:hypothetical protein